MTGPNDLLEAHASVDWPMSRFLDLHGRLESWLTQNVTIEANLHETDMVRFRMKQGGVEIPHF